MRQEIIYLKYLREVAKFNKQRSYSEWKRIKNGTAANFNGDEDQLYIEFQNLYKKSKSKKYLFYNCSKKLDPIVIYSDELSIINDLIVPVWVKQYWLCLLAYYKFDSQVTGAVEKTPSLNSWAIRQTDRKSKNYGGNCQDSIAKYKNKTGIPVINDFVKGKNNKYPTYKPVLIQNSGKIVCTCKTIANIDKLLRLAKETGICSCCGEEFNVTKDTKTDLCPRCLKKKSSTKKPDSKKKCKNCGKFFLSSSKCKRKLCLSCWKIKESARVKEYKQRKIKELQGKN